MSAVVGSELPSDIFAALSASETDRPFLAIPVTTVDDAGWPHPALLSYGEVIALSPGRLRFAVAGRSVTAANLRRSGRITLSLIEPARVLYVKAAARRLEDARLAQRGLTLFEAQVATVLADAPHADEAGGAVLDGIRFAPTGAPERIRRKWGAMLALLREPA